jgi:glucokinase
MGIDVGGSKIVAGLVEFPSGTLLCKHRIPTLPERGGRPVLDDTLRLAAQLLDEAGESHLAGIGIGIAELIDLHGNISSGHTIAWQNLPVQAELADILSPVVVEADVRAAAQAEAIWGAGNEYDQFVYITIGTGISSCLVQDQRPYKGAHGHALVLASGPATILCANCGTLQNTVLEEVASGPALVHRYNAKAADKVHKAEDVIKAADNGDDLARDIVTSAAVMMGSSIALLVNTLDPEAVIIGGGLGMAGGFYWQTLIESTQTHIWMPSLQSLPIRRAEFGADAGLVGAAAAVVLTRFA